MADQRLTEFDKFEWRDICRALRPGITDTEFDELWAAFQQDKAERVRSRAMN